MFTNQLVILTIVNRKVGITINLKENRCINLFRHEVKSIKYFTFVKNICKNSRGKRKSRIPR